MYFKLLELINDTSTECFTAQKYNHTEGWSLYNSPDSPTPPTGHHRWENWFFVLSNHSHSKRSGKAHYGKKSDKEKPMTKVSTAIKNGKNAY